MPETAQPSPPAPPAPTNCLVTGCAGFVGSHLAQALLEQGHSVLGVDNYFSGRPGNMLPFADHPRFSFVQKSIAEPGLWDAVFSQHGPFDAVFHLAAIVSVPYSMSHADETLEINFRSTERLLDAAQRNGARRFRVRGLGRGSTARKSACP